jgi:hypothetical protein
MRETSQVFKEWGIVADRFFLGAVGFGNDMLESGVFVLGGLVYANKNNGTLTDF